MRDIRSNIDDYLGASGTDLYTEVGSRVWSPIPPQGFENDNPALTYQITGNRETSGTPMHDLTVLFTCYGGDTTFTSAENVEQALNDRLDGMTTLTEATLVERITSNQILDEPTGWPVVKTSFRIVYPA